MSTSVASQAQTELAAPRGMASIVRGSGMFLPWAVVLFGIFVDWFGAAGVALVGIVAVLNVWALAWIVGRFAADAEAGFGGGAMAFVLLKLPLLALAVVGAVIAFGPFPVVVGVTAVLSGAAVGSLRPATAEVSE